MELDRNLVVKAEKWAIWLGLITIIFLLRHLFPIFFLTFVLTYIANTAVNALTKRVPRRKLNVVIVYLLLLALLAGVALLVVPRMVAEATNLARLYIRTEAARGDVAEGQVEAVREGVIAREARELVDSFIVAIAGRDTFYSFRESDAYAVLMTRLNNALKKAEPNAVRALTMFINGTVIFISHFIVSIILSFLMLWNLPETKARMKRFAYGRTADVYAEIAPGLRAFGIMLGRAFEAQTVVAIVNAALSCIVFVILGLPSVALLAFKVGGPTHVGWLLVAILVIHAIEAYMLNPFIYGRHLRLHPLAVLVILLVGEHLFGVWGLLLGVPIAAFVLRYVIEGEDVVVPKPQPVRASSAPPLPAGE